MFNNDIRQAVKEADIKMYALADKLGMADTTLCRKLRKEFSEEEKLKAFQAINELSQEK